MQRQPAYLNLLGCWLLTFTLSIGKLLSLTDMSWWWAVSPIITVNVVFASIAVARGLLLRVESNED